MGDKIDIPTSGLGGLLLLGGAAALTYYLWPRKAGGGGVMVPAGTGRGAGGGGGGSSGASSGASSGETSYYSPSTSTTEPSTESPSSSPDYSTGVFWQPDPGNLQQQGIFSNPGGLGDLSDPRVDQYSSLAAQVRNAQSRINSTYDSWHAGIFTRMVGGDENVKLMIDSSNATADAIANALQELADNPDATYPNGARKDKAVVEVAARWSGSASSIIQQLNATSFLAEEWDFVKRLPSSLQTVMSYTVNAAGDVVAGAAWGLGKTALILGGAVALIGLMLSRAGVSIDAGPVRVKAKE